MSFDLIERFHSKALELNLGYLIIGGYAASYWGTPRFTADIDFVLCEEEFSTATELLASLGYQLQFRHPKGAFAHFSPIGKENEGFRVDLMLVDRATWEKLNADGVDADLGGPQAYRMVGVYHFIAMKLHSAKQVDRKEFQKDLNDIARVMTKNLITYEDLETSGILEKHGSEKTRAILRSIIGS